MIEQRLLDDAIRFIRNNNDLLKNENLDALYKIGIDKKMPFISTLSQVLIDAGIDPLDYCDELYNSMFQDCSFDKLTITKPYKHIPRGLCFHCTALTDVTIASDIKSIEQKAFAYCESLKEIILPKSLIAIEDFSFLGCSNLTTVKYLGTVNDFNALTLGTKAFSETKVNEIICTDGTVKVDI